MNAPDLPAGTLVGGDFRVVETLARGGMGVVYVAEQESTRKRRALKVMSPQGGDVDALRKRFEQEAHVSGQIESDHVVEVIGAGVDPATNMPWIAMEMLEGEDLENHLTRAGPLDWTDTWNVVGELCHALAAAHELGLIHRDLKPSNVFLAKSRRPGVARVVKILDFGIAKRMTDAGKTTGALGTPLYMAPEQTATGSSFSPATDVWALGLVVFEAMVGVPFWKSASQEDAIAALLREVILEPIPPASERAAHFGRAARLPPGFDAWFARCVVREPPLRFPDAGAAYRELARVFAQATGLSERAIPPPPSSVARPRDPGGAPPDSIAREREALQARTQPAFETNAAPRARTKSRAGVLVAGIAAGVAVMAIALAVVFVVGVAGPPQAAVSASPAADPAPALAPSVRTSEPHVEVVPSVPASAAPMASASAPGIASATGPATTPTAPTPSSASPPSARPAPQAPRPPPDAPVAPPARPAQPKPPPAQPDPVIL